MKQEEQNLQNTNRLLNLILNSSFGNIFVTDGTGKIIYVNDNAARALGVPRQQLLTMTAYEVVAQNLASSAASITALESGQECMQAVRVSDGVTLAVNAKPLFNNAGEIEYVVVFSQNRTVVEHFMHSIQQENQVIRQALSHMQESVQADEMLVAESPATRSCLSVASKAARLDSTIMLYGESGTGKEVFARFIHRSSRRAQRLFLPVNCAAIPQELMESEFFGYEKGAFTGSSREGKLGLFELADGGTLFLDEIGELNLPMQSKLLRVLETGEIKRVGGTRIQKVNVRIVAATNRDLHAMAADGSFREDLFYRLNVIPITIPPLRDRREDTTVFATYFLDRLNKKYSARKRFTQAALDVFQSYPWPGNVRELRNVVERTFVIVSEDVITDRHVADVLGVGGQKVKFAVERAIPVPLPDGSLHEATERFQREYISKIVHECGGSVQQAARQMRIGRSGLYKKMDKLGMKPGRPGDAP